MFHSRDAETIVGQGDKTGTKVYQPTKVSKAILENPRRGFPVHLLGKFLLHLLVGTIFFAIIPVVLSSNQILFLNGIADLRCIISMLEGDATLIQKGHLCSSYSLEERQVRRMLPSAPLSGVPGSFNGR